MLAWRNVVATFTVASGAPNFNSGSRCVGGVLTSSACVNAPSHLHVRGVLRCVGSHPQLAESEREYCVDASKAMHEVADLVMQCQRRGALHFLRWRRACALQHGVYRAGWCLRPTPGACACFRARMQSTQGRWCVGVWVCVFAWVRMDLCVGVWRCVGVNVDVGVPQFHLRMQ